MLHIGRKIKKFRIENNLSQKEFAEKILKAFYHT